MFSNYFIIAIRNLTKRKLYSFINAIGLAIGIAFSVLIYLFVQDERSFDQFHINNERIYRLNESSYDQYNLKGRKDPMRYSAYLPLPLGQAIRDEIPDVQYLTRFNSGSRAIVRYGDKVFSEQVTFVDADFYRMFSFPLVQGSVDNLFNDVYEAVLTPQLAAKYFGDEDPIGKVLTVDMQGEHQFTVTGIIEAPPANSSFSFKMLMPIQSQPWYERNKDQWGSFGYPTFVQLNDHVRMIDVKPKLDSLVERHMGDRLERWRTDAQIPPEYPVFELTYTPLTGIHLDTKVSWEKVSDPLYSWILGGIALLIIIIASINYISLALTTSASRKVEVGIRKVVGAHHHQLVSQFGMESVTLAIIAWMIGLAMVAFFLPAFNEFTNKQLTLVPGGMWEVILISLFVAIGIGLMAGSYPSFFLSRFKPVSVLKGGFTSKVKAGFTKPLVVFQFFLSASMIICSIIMFRQMDFISSKDLGFDKDQILVIPTQTGWNEEADRVVEQLRNELSREPDVLHVAGTSSSFNQGWSRYGFKINGENKASYVYRVDPKYIELLNLTLVEGRNFDDRIASDSGAVLINEALARDMGWTNPLDEYLNWREDSIGPGAKVIGVLKDYHFLSLERSIDPMFLSMDKKNTGFLTTILVKLSAGDTPEKISRVKTVWSTLYPDKPFDYTFLDQDLARQYASHQRWMKITGLSTGFAIFISCLGLFGLSGINSVNRIKEIGIRKVMGADILQIFVLLNRQFIWLSVIAFALAIPISWYVMKKWLSTFTYSITIGWEIFIFSMLVGLILALSTVSYHAVRGALVNPAETLKYE